MRRVGESSLIKNGMSRDMKEMREKVMRIPRRRWVQAKATASLKPGRLQSMGSRRVGRD